MLTQKQRRCVEEYATGRNGTRAAILAGYSARTARAVAHENLRKPEIADAIERLSAAEKRKSQTTLDSVLSKLTYIALRASRIF